MLFLLSKAKHYAFPSHHKVVPVWTIYCPHNCLCIRVKYKELVVEWWSSSQLTHTSDFSLIILNIDPTEKFTYHLINTSSSVFHFSMSCGKLRHTCYQNRQQQRRKWNRKQIMYRTFFLLAFAYIIFCLKIKLHLKAQWAHQMHWTGRQGEMKESSRVEGWLKDYWQTERQQCAWR